MSVSFVIILFLNTGLRFLTTVVTVILDMSLELSSNMVALHDLEYWPLELEKPGLPGIDDDVDGNNLCDDNVEVANTLELSFCISHTI
jgi:hypothetical protein